MGDQTTLDPIVAPTLSPPDPVKCDRYYTEHNKTFLLYGGYEGIPENLAINVVAWLVLLILFSILRKLAWDYGRIALVSRTEARWTSLFYGDHSSLSDVRASQESLDTLVNRQDKGFCSWIPAFFKLRDEHILAKAGLDAVQYLTFQRYLLIYLSVITVLCIGVVLPVNFQGELEGTTQTFGHTTISNIDANSSTLWVHAVFAVLFLVIAIFFMRHFSANLQYEEDEQVTRTLLISNIPKDRCYKNTLLLHFQEAYPEAPVQDIQFAYNIRKLMKLANKRQRALEGLVTSESLMKVSGERPTLFPYPCGQLCCCTACGCKQVDAIDYYTHEASVYREKSETQKILAFRSTLGISFITFEDDHTAARVYTDFKMSCKGAHNPMSSSVSRELNAHNWEVRYAPAPDNIHWSNLSVSPEVWWLKAISVNILLFLLLFFLTTPSVFLNLLNSGGYQKALSELRSPILVQFVPAFLMWLISSLLPLVVYYSDYYCIGHWTRTAEHHAVMRKTYIFLIIMVLILPSLGLTSAKAFIERFAKDNDFISKFRWQCIFIPDNGAFFVNYVITSAFIGTAAELARIPELLLYAVKLMCARSTAERTSIRKSLVWEFQYGCQYAWMLCVFTVTMAFSLLCPLITPFGLIYLIMKHLVDKYNIYFAYAPSRIDKNIHTSAINFVMVATILLQFNVLFFTILRGELVRAIVIFGVVALFGTLLIFFGGLCFGWFRGLSPIRYKKVSDSASDGSAALALENKPFIPAVLMESADEEDMVQSDFGATFPAHTYGSTDPPDASLTGTVNQAAEGIDT